MQLMPDKGMIGLNVMHAMYKDQGRSWREAELVKVVLDQRFYSTRATIGELITCGYLYWQGDKLVLRPGVEAQTMAKYLQEFTSDETVVLDTAGDLANTLLLKYAETITLKDLFTGMKPTPIFKLRFKEIA